MNNLEECFRHLGFENGLNSTIYTQIAADKFSLNDRLRWNEYIVQNQITRVTLFDFNRWLRQFALACYRMPNVTQSNRPSNNIDDSPRHSAPSMRPDQPKCPLDNQNHYLGHCETFKKMSAGSRKKKCLEQKRCFNCLGTHTVKECNCQSRCKSCNGTHHTLLHEPSSSNEKRHPSQSLTTIDSHNALKGSKPSQLLPVLPVSVSSNNITLNTYALLDMGSTCSFLLQDSADKLNLTSRLAQQAEHIFVKGIHKSVELEAHPVSVQVKGFAMESPATDINSLLVVNTLKFDHAVLNNLCEKYSHLNDFTFPSFSNNQITLLIGIDNFDLIVPTKVLTGPPNTPRAVECKLGWSITGPNNINTICTSLNDTSHLSPV